MVYQTVMRPILLYGCEKRKVQVTDERMLQVFDNDSVHCIRHLKRRECVPSVDLRRRLCLTRIPALVQSCCKMPRWWTDQGANSTNTASLVAQANWRPAEDVGNHDQGRPGAPLRTASYRTGWKSLESSHRCLRPWRGLLDWWSRLNPPRVNTDTITSRYVL